MLLTSNNSRELSDALRRRCLYMPIGFPDPTREAEIIRARLPGIEQRLALELSRFVSRVRDLALKKSPSVAESIDWARCLVAL